MADDMAVKALAKEIEFLRGKIDKIESKVKADVHECDCEYGGCYHSYAEEIMELLKGI